jgi:hypothetical protein
MNARYDNEARSEIPSQSPAAAIYCMIKQTMNGDVNGYGYKFMSKSELSFSNARRAFENFSETCLLVRKKATEKLRI